MMTMIIDDLKMLQVGQLILAPNIEGDGMVLSRIHRVYDPDSPPIWVQPDYLIYASPDDKSFGDYYALDEILGGDCPHCGNNMVIGKHRTTEDGYCDDGSDDDVPF